MAKLTKAQYTTTLEAPNWIAAKFGRLEARPVNEGWLPAGTLVQDVSQSTTPSGFRCWIFRASLDGGESWSTERAAEAPELD